MNNQELSPEELEKLWKWCGFKKVDPDRIPFWQKPEDYQRNFWYANNHWVYPDGSKNLNPPVLTLDNLFRYAVPKLQAVSLRSMMPLNKIGKFVAVITFNDLFRTALNIKPEVALAKAILEVIK